ncbi:hypothetical protein MOQ_001919 [Trypanosoma cruzi marinkellei]|uniref:CRAL-TRIO domain-containing protein n=1 Tax=Trypanosoma cruzi marinkellei TaxID=85056 RepID=K2NJD7_TRYCR|nr:hypothetical protein MOQ_001919 [Trypanosoma cruzi marinkellei]
MTDQMSTATQKELECVAYLKQNFPPTFLDPEDAGFLTDYTYLRFTRARNAHKEKALAMLSACLDWRKEFKPQKITYGDVAHAMKQCTIIAAGRCRKGRPILVMTVGIPNACEVDERVKQIVYLLEEIGRRGQEGITWIIDFAELGKHTRDPRASETRKATMKILQDYYPELLGALFLYRTPWYVRFLYTAVRPFLDKRTRRKVFSLGNDENLLLNYVSRDQIPESLGGTFRTDGSKPFWE